MTAQDLIFLSYRRADSRSDTGRIYDYLVRQVGRECIFRDVDSIELGTENFQSKLEHDLSKSQVVLVVIGEDWLNAREEGSQTRRLDDPNDFVRREIRLALQLGITIIPILLHGTSMPSRKVLPEDIRNLCDSQAAVVQDASFYLDMERLIKGIRSSIVNRRKEHSRSSETRQQVSFTYRYCVREHENTLGRLLRWFLKRESSFCIKESSDEEIAGYGCQRREESRWVQPSRLCHGNS